MLYIYAHPSKVDDLAKENDGATVVKKGTLKSHEIVKVEVPDTLDALERLEMATHEFEMKLRELSAMELAESLISSLEGFCDRT